VLPLVPRLPEVLPLPPRLPLRRALPEVVLPLVEEPEPEVLLIEPEPDVVLIEPEVEPLPLVEPMEPLVEEPGVLPVEPAVEPLVEPEVLPTVVPPVVEPAVVPVVVWAKAALVVSPKPSRKAAARSGKETCFFIDTERESGKWEFKNILLTGSRATARARRRARAAGATRATHIAAARGTAATGRGAAASR
jgi:hypothetical protein